MAGPDRYWLAFLVVLTTTAIFGRDQFKNVRMEIRVDQNLGSDISHDGETFTGRLNRKVSLGPNVVLPKGSIVKGVVRNAETTMRYHRPGVLDLELTSVSSDEKTYRISTNTLRLMGRMDPTGKQDEGKARREDATRAAAAVVLGGTTSTTQTIPGTDIAVGTSDRAAGMQVILPKNSKLTFTVTSSE